MTWVSQQVLAEVARASGMRFGDIEATGVCAGKSLDNALRKLRSRELVACEGRRYSCTDAGRAFLAAGKRLTSGPRGKQPGKRLYADTLRERVWRAARIKRKFSLPELLEIAARGEDRDAESNAGKYLRALKRAGFLAELPTRARGLAPTSNGCKRYLLVRDTGPQAPRWLPHRGIVFDPNDEQEHAL